MTASHELCSLFSTGHQEGNQGQEISTCLLIHQLLYNLDFLRSTNPPTQDFSILHTHTKPHTRIQSEIVDDVVFPKIHASFKVILFYLR